MALSKLILEHHSSIFKGYDINLNLFDYQYRYIGLNLKERIHDLITTLQEYINIP